MDSPPYSRDLKSLRDRSSFISFARASAVEVHGIVYGHDDPSESVLDRLYEPSAVYENPLLTASSRAVLSDIHLVTNRVAALDIPRPSVVLATLLGKRDQVSHDPWFRACTVWSELGSVCESESFDDARVTLMEHTMHVVFLPQLHTVPPAADHQYPSTPSLGVVSTSSLHSSLIAAQRHHPHTTTHAPPVLLSVAGGRLQVPSPLHFELRVTTRLSFNEAGRITYHRDSWDVRDVVSLLPGLGLAQAVTTRIAAFALSAAAKLLGHRRPDGSTSTPTEGLIVGGGSEGKGEDLGASAGGLEFRSGTQQ